MINLLAVAGPAAAAVAYFIFGQTLFAVGGLGVLTAMGLAKPLWRKPFGLATALFVYLLLDFLINELGIHYPYTNILTLAGMIGVFVFTGLPWSGLFFLPGKSREWWRSGLLLGVLMAAIILAIVRFVPTALLVNPVPRQWPLDVLLIIAIGYATFSALMEETMFRSLMVAFAMPHFSLPMAIVAQGLLFGLLHFHRGVPVGVPGILLGALWGLAAGWIVMKAESIYPAYLMHFVVVLIVFIGLIFFPV